MSRIEEAFLSMPFFGHRLQSETNVKAGAKHMQAIIVTGGKQYNVTEGQLVYIEKLNAEAGEAVVFDQVLAIVDGENTKFGTPVVEGAKVEATVVKNGKGKKVRVYKYKAKKGYHKRQGHRQPYTKVEIGKISV